MSGEDVIRLHRLQKGYIRGGVPSKNRGLGARRGHPTVPRLQGYKGYKSYYYMSKYDITYHKKFSLSKK